MGKDPNRSVRARAKKPVATAVAVIRDRPITEFEDAELKQLMAADATTFYPWQRDLVLWYIEKSRRSKEDCLAKCEELTGETWTFPRFKEMMATHVALREYLTIARERGRRFANASIGYLSVDAVDYLKHSMKEAKDDGNYEALGRISSRAFELAMPRKNEVETPRININLNLSEAQKALLDAELSDPEL